MVRINMRHNKPLASNKLLDNLYTDCKVSIHYFSGAAVGENKSISSRLCLPL